MDVKELQELGLSEQESKIYLALVSLGKSSASSIASEAKVSHGTIYDLLAKLEQKGLAKTVPEATKKFIATDPNHLLSYVEKRETTLKDLRKNIKDLQKRYELEEPQPVVMAQGKANFYKLKSEMKPHSKRDYSIRPMFDPDPVTYRKMKERTKKGVDYALLYGPRANKTSIQKYEKKQIPMKPLPIDNVVVSVHDDETIVTLLKKNTTLLIRDKDFSDLLVWFMKQVLV